jgi:hypothetical protein
VTTKRKKVVRRKPANKPGADAMKLFNEFWHALVCDNGGRLNRNAVINELWDYFTLMGSASKVYDHVTGGKISKANTDPSVVIAVATDTENEALEAILKDEKEQWLLDYEREPMVDICHVALV